MLELTEHRAAPSGRHDDHLVSDGRQIGFLRATGPAIESAI
jgi:hypothetical protein